MSILVRKDATLSHKTLNHFFGLGVFALIIAFYGVGYALRYPIFSELNFAYVLGPILFVVTVPLTAYLMEHIREGRELKRHQADLEKFCAEHQYSFSAAPPWQGQAVFSHMSLLGLGKREASFRNCIDAGAWKYGEFSYAVYRKTRRGEYKSETVYYGVMAAELPRALPNVFFDSKQARGRQFRFHFAGSQAHSLEGDFDNFFVTYFPPDYTIDGMSFITPEVMWALREAADYDVEIAGNQLFVYAPIYHDENRLNDMAAKLLAIKEKLLHNILTYRDERLPVAEGRKTVAAQGVKLQRSKFMQRVALAVTIVYIILYILAEIYD